MAYTTVDIEYDFDEAWSDLLPQEQEEFILEEATARGLISSERNDPFNLDDSFRLLELIVELRKRGYSVELNA